MEEINQDIPNGNYNIQLFDQDFKELPKQYYYEEDRQVIQQIQKIQKKSHGSHNLSDIKQDLKNDFNGLDLEQQQQMRLQFKKLKSSQGLYYKVLKAFNLLDQHCCEYRKKHNNSNGLLVRMICCDCNSILVLDYRNPHNVLVNLSRPHDNKNHNIQQQNKKRKENKLNQSDQDQSQNEEINTPEDSIYENDENKTPVNSPQSKVSFTQKLEESQQKVKQLDLGQDDEDQSKSMQEEEEPDFFTGNLIPYALDQTSGFNPDWYKAIKQFKINKELQWIANMKTHYQQIETSIGVTGIVYCYCCAYKPTINEYNMADYQLKQAIVIKNINGDLSWQCSDYEVVEKHITFDQRKDNQNLIKQVQINGKVFYSCMKWIKFEKSNAYPVKVNKDLFFKKPTVTKSKDDDVPKRSGLPLKKVGKFKSIEKK